jgi:hypothetical protein
MSGTASTYLGANSYLTSGQSIASPSGLFTALMQPDGNFVVYHSCKLGSDYVWATMTQGKPTGYVIMQSDGNLVCYSGTPGQSGNTPTWWSGTVNQGGLSLALTDDGTLMIFASDPPPSDFSNPIWTSGASDPLVSVTGGSLSYDTDPAAVQIVTGAPINGAEVQVKNSSDTEQTEEAVVTNELSQTSGWSSTVGASISVSISAEVGIPIIASGSVTVTADASYSYEWNGSTTWSTGLSATIQVNVPAHRTYQAKMVVTPASLSCPYTLSGTLTFKSGFACSGSVNGTYSGVNADVIQYVIQGGGTDTAIERGIIPKKDMLALRGRKDALVSAGG